MSAPWHGGDVPAVDDPHRRLVPLGAGHRLEAELSGTRPPTVVLIAGAGDTSWYSFDRLVPELPKGLSVVSYARPGLGRSDRPSDRQSQTFMDAAEELCELLERLGSAAPYVLVGHSVGALIAEVFAMRHPELVGAIVLVDASSPPLWFSTHPPKSLVSDGDAGVPFDVVQGAAELDDASVPHLPAYVVSSRIGRWHDLPEADLEYWAPLTRGELEAGWQEGQAALARRWAADHRVAGLGGHRVQLDEPGLVAEVVGSAVEAARRAGSHASANM